jgi:hypothetical protein
VSVELFDMSPLHITRQVFANFFLLVVIYYLLWVTGGSRKILGISYADGSEIPKRSRQLVWRVAVQMSRNASQLALQVTYNYLFYILY